MKTISKLTAALLFGLSGLACVSFAQTTAVAPPSPNSVCSLISSAVIAKLQSAQFVDSKPMARDDGHFKTATCYYKMKPDYQSVSLEIITRSNHGDSDPRKLWDKKFRAGADDHDADAHEKDAHEKKEDRGEDAEENEHHKPPEHVEDVGDDAYWVDTGRDGALYVLKGKQIIRLSLGGRTPQQEKRTRAIRIANSVLRK